MPTNDFKTFAKGPGANIMDQATYNTNAAITTGVQAGIADSALANKTWHQSSFWSETLAQFIVNVSAVDVLDDGDVAGAIAKFEAALARYITTDVLFQSFLSGPADFYVGGTGASDTNDGKSATVTGGSGPWATLPHAVSQLKTINNNGFPISVHCTGNFSQGINVQNPFPGGGQINFIFASGSSITVATSGCIIATEGAAFQISGPVTLSATQPSPTAGGDGDAMFTATGGTITYSGVQFGACTGAHMVAIGGVIQGVANYNIVGGAQNHFLATDGGLISPNVSATVITVTLVGTPAFTFFALSESLSEILCASSRVVFTGPATGTRFAVDTNAVIQTFGAGTSYFPGTTTPVPPYPTGGQYN